MKTLKSLALTCGMLAVSGLLWGNANASSVAAREWGTVLDMNGDAPDQNLTNYIVYATGDESQIHTEWGVDSSGGVNGYLQDLNANIGYYFCALDNLNGNSGLSVGESFTVEMSYYHGSVKERALTNALAPASTNTSLTPAPGMDLILADDPALPERPLISGDFNLSFTTISLDWAVEALTDYDVYISEGPSGAGNGRGNGVYYRIAVDIQPPYTFSDFNVPYYLAGTAAKPVDENSASYYFVVFGKNGAGRSPASEELVVTTEPPVPEVLPTPATSTWGIIVLLTVMTLLFTSRPDIFSNKSWIFSTFHGRNDE